MDEITPDPTTCWHLGQPGQRGPAVTLEYLSALEGACRPPVVRRAIAAMNQDLALRVLANLMHWPDDRARREFQWLRLMARLKYDGYRDFQAGMRFIETLVTWLQQFSSGDRETAYASVRHTLVYIGPNEMHQLVEQFYPRIVHDRLVRTVASQHHIPTYRVHTDPAARVATNRLRRPDYLHESQ